MLASGYHNLNHGSFGAVPRDVMKSQQEWASYVELKPDVWYRYEVYPAVNKVRKQLATYIGADEEDVVFVINASHGVNAVIRSLVFPPGSKVLYLSEAYPMVKNTFAFMRDHFQEKLIEVPLTFPTTKDKIIDLVKQELAKHQLGEIKLASFSHIVSTPAVILPVKELIELCHQHGAMVLIDGAHTLGNIPINVAELNADFYLSNGHKWFYTPKGSAFLWVRKDRQSIVYPTVISYLGQGKTPFQVGFSYEGTSDYSATLAFSAAFEFRQSLGDAAIMAYMRDLALKGGDLLAQMWGTEVLMRNELDAIHHAMINVRLPTENSTIASKIGEILLNKYNIVVPVYGIQMQTLDNNNNHLKNNIKNENENNNNNNDNNKKRMMMTQKWWVRVSAQIYLELSDFEMLGKRVLEIIKNLKG